MSGEPLSQCWRSGNRSGESARFVAGVGQESTKLRRKQSPVRPSLSETPKGPSLQEAAAAPPPRPWTSTTGPDWGGWSRDGANLGQVSHGAGFAISRVGAPLTQLVGEGKIEPGRRTPGSTLSERVGQNHPKSSRSRPKFGHARPRLAEFASDLVRVRLRRTLAEFAPDFVMCADKLAETQSWPIPPTSADFGPKCRSMRTLRPKTQWLIPEILVGVPRRKNANSTPRGTFHPPPTHNYGRSKCGENQVTRRLPRSCSRHVPDRCPRRSRPNPKLCKHRPEVVQIPPCLVELGYALAKCRSAG